MLEFLVMVVIKGKCLLDPNSKERDEWLLGVGARAKS